MKDLPVLISEASPGFGRARAVFLNKNGFRVFSGVRYKSDGTILQKDYPGKIAPHLVDVLDPIYGKALSSFDEMVSKSDNEVFHLFADLNSQTAEYSLNSNGIPFENAANPVHQIFISNKSKNRYLLGKDAIFFKLINFFCILRDRVMLTIKKI